HIDCEEAAVVAGAEEPPILEVNVKPMGARRWNLVGSCYSVGIFAFDRDNLWRFGNVDVETARLVVEHRPPRSSRHNNVGRYDLLACINHRYGDGSVVVLFGYFW